MRIKKKNLLYTILVLTTHIDGMVKEYDKKIKDMKEDIDELRNYVVLGSAISINNIMGEEDKKEEEEEKDAIR